MPDWLAQLLDQWPEFVAVFLGAAVGAALTMWLSERSQRRRDVEAAFASIQARLAVMTDSLFQSSFGMAEVVGLGQDIVTITWRTPRRMRMREKTQEFVAAYQELMDAVRERRPLDPQRVLAGLGRLQGATDAIGEALHSQRFVPLHVLTPERITEDLQALKEKTDGSDDPAEEAGSEA